jgi:transposase
MSIKKNKRNGRLPNKTVEAREQFVFEFAQKHPNATAREINEALGPKFDGIPMRNIRIYEIAKAARKGATSVPPVQSGKRPSKREAKKLAEQVTTTAQATPPAATGPAQRRGRNPTAGQEALAVEKAVRDLQDAGFADIDISYKVSKRVHVG